MEQMIPLIEARDLTIGHRGKTLVPNIDFRLMQGQILGLLGPNGTGKTTLFRTLLGLIPAISGEVLLDGQRTSSLPPVQIASRLAHVPQSMASPFAFTAMDIVLMGASSRLGPFARPGQLQHDQAKTALDRLGIAGLAQAPINQLSGGQRQLVLIARAMAQDAKAVIMDEPTGSLDFANRRQVSTAIRQLASAGVGIILSSHDPDHAAAIADQALLLHRDGVLAYGPISRTMSSANLSQLYEIPVRRQQGPDNRLHFY